jgi:hypothetical protein
MSVPSAATVVTSALIPAVVQRGSSRDCARASPAAEVVECSREYRI